MKQKIFFLPALFLMIVGISIVASAQAPSPPPMTAQTTETSSQTLNEETDPPLKLAPDKSELVHLGRDAASVVVGNPAHITVMLDTPRLAVVIPRAEGATYFTVLDKKGDVIMQRHVLVSGPKKNYVRIRRSCANVTDGKECKPTSVYFCPDMCHEIKDPGAAEGPASTANQ